MEVAASRVRLQLPIQRLTDQAEGIGHFLQGADTELPLGRFY